MVEIVRLSKKSSTYVSGQLSYEGRVAAELCRAHLSTPLPRLISGDHPGLLTIPSCDHPTALTTTSWDVPAGDSTPRLGYGEQDHPLGNAPHGHRSAVGAQVSSR